MNLNALKSQIRSSVRMRREALEADEVGRAGEILAENLKEIDDPDFRSAIASARAVALYSAVGGELPCDEAEQFFRENGCRICYPRVTGDRMDFYEVTDRASQMTVGSYDIPEPKMTCEKVDATDIDIMLVPAVAYTEDGMRLGRGGGFYDRWLNGAEAAGHVPFAIGICYDFQVYSALPVEAHDHAVDCVLCVVTEEDGE